MKIPKKMNVIFKKNLALCEVPKKKLIVFDLALCEVPKKKLIVFDLA